ncbi:MAG: M20/M25/M40 family metallo-hydrolase, partial [Gemmatimonadales bacterium]
MDPMKKVGQVLPATIALMLMGVVAPLHAQSLSQEKRTALEKVDELTADIENIARTLWDYSETALLEFQSAEFLSGLLEAEGFTVERGVAGMPTAFVASYGTGSPVIGVLAEFDALPGVGNAPLPRKEVRADGIQSGQGCGHNLFGAGSVGGAIAIKRAIEALGLAGTIRLYGTPAEETVVGKVYMANAGLFDGLDAAIEWHPYLETAVNNNP